MVDDGQASATKKWSVVRVRGLSRDRPCGTPMRTGNIRPHLPCKATNLPQQRATDKSTSNPTNQTSYKIIKIQPTMSLWLLRLLDFYLSHSFASTSSTHGKWSAVAVDDTRQWSFTCGVCLGPDSDRRGAGFCVVKPLVGQALVRVAVRPGEGCYGLLWVAMDFYGLLWVAGELYANFLKYWVAKDFFFGATVSPFTCGKLRRYNVHLNETCVWRKLWRLASNTTEWCSSSV